MLLVDPVIGCVPVAYVPMRPQELQLMGASFWIVRKVFSLSWLAFCPVKGSLRSTRVSLLTGDKIKRVEKGFVVSVHLRQSSSKDSCASVLAST